VLKVDLPTRQAKYVNELANFIAKQREMSFARFIDFFLRHLSLLLRLFPTITVQAGQLSAFNNQYFGTPRPLSRSSPIARGQRQKAKNAKRVNDYPRTGWLYYAAKGRETKRNVSSHVYVWDPARCTGFVFKQSAHSSYFKATLSLIYPFLLKAVWDNVTGCKHENCAGLSPWLSFIVYGVFDTRLSETFFSQEATVTLATGCAV
jgi:hypothetical protein